jgi:membrane protease YdiL (CAAX protease family)
MLLLGLFCPGRAFGGMLFYTTFLAGLSEELLFRGFAFGLLVQLGRMRVWSAAILTGVIFGLVHLVNVGVRDLPLSGQVPWIGMIALGGVLYAWLFWRWRYNLWLVITLHTLMNLWWGVFELDASTLGSWGATASRVLTIALAITITELAARGRRFSGLIQPGASEV